MKLDRNINPDGKGKYALLLLRHLGPSTPVNNEAVNILRASGALDFGDDEESDFFVIRLKDKYAAPALGAYALAAYKDDPEYAIEVLKLAKLAELHPQQKRPD